MRAPAHAGSADLLVARCGHCGAHWLHSAGTDRWEPLSLGDRAAPPRDA